MDFTNLSPYFNQIDLIKDAANQLIKDFELFGLEIKFSGNAYNAYEELFEQVEPRINKLISTNQQKFMNILYRIDLSETQIKKALEDSNEPFSAVVSDLIIKRELQKVVIRKYFKKS